MEHNGEVGGGRILAEPRSGALASPARQIVDVAGHRVGRDFLLIAGPCAVESYEQTLATARRVKAAGAHMLRGGAFKPRTSPLDFQGLGPRALEILRAAREETGLPVVTEVMDPRRIEEIGQVADMFQVGSRNMQNFPLLRELGRTNRPVLLKRGMNATLDEWLSAADYVLAGGNHRVILCERGIRTFETSTRNTLDLSIVPAAKARTPLPVIVDPSHGTGRADLIHPMSLAAVAAGADGLLIEVHPDPRSALSDAKQQLTPEAFDALAGAVRGLLAHLGGTCR